MGRYRKTKKQPRRRECALQPRQGSSGPAQVHDAREETRKILPEFVVETEDALPIDLLEGQHPHEDEDKVRIPETFRMDWDEAQEAEDQY